MNIVYKNYTATLANKFIWIIYMLIVMNWNRCKWYREKYILTYWLRVLIAIPIIQSNTSRISNKLLFVKQIIFWSRYYQKMDLPKYTKFNKKFYFFPIYYSILTYTIIWYIFNLNIPNSTTNSIFSPLKVYSMIKWTI